MPIFKKHLAGDRGANMVEYSLIVALVALMSFAAVTLLGERTADTFTTAAGALGDGQPDESGSVDAGGSEGSNSADNGSNNDGSSNGAADDQAQDDEAQDDQAQDDEAQLDDQAQSDEDQDDEAQDDEAQDDDGAQSNEDQDEEQLEAPADDEADDEADGEDDDTAGSDDGSQDGQNGGADETTNEPETETGPVSTGSSSELYWWDSHDTEGQWTASVSYKNETNRHQYLTFEVTKTDDKGKTTTTTVKDFYVGAGTSSTYTNWSNDIDKDWNKVKGTLKVEVRVVSVRTSDQNWQTYSYEVNGAPASVTAPALP